MKDKILQFIKKYWIAFVIVIASILVDVVTKAIIVKTFNNQPVFGGEGEIVVIKNFFSITYVRNDGAGWSLFAGKRWALILVSLLGTLLFAFLMKDYDMKKHRYYSLGISLMLGGTIGNLIERIGQGYVTDFLDFIIFGYDYPVFNVADICLVAGAISLVISLIITKEDVFESKKDPLANQSDIQTDNQSEEQSNVEEVNQDK